MNVIEYAIQMELDEEKFYRNKLKTIKVTACIHYI